MTTIKRYSRTLIIQTLNYPNSSGNCSITVFCQWRMFYQSSSTEPYINQWTSFICTFFVIQLAQRCSNNGGTTAPLIMRPLYYTVPDSQYSQNHLKPVLELLTSFLLFSDDPKCITAMENGHFLSLNDGYSNHFTNHADAD